MTGPHTDGEMRSRYNKGAVGEMTLVRCLPHEGVSLRRGGSHSGDSGERDGGDVGRDIHCTRRAAFAVPGTPTVEEQAVNPFAELRELCTAAGPPFMERS